MKYYILAQKEERGCPRGELNAVLYDQFHENPEKIEHGYFPWYVSKYSWTGHQEKFPIGLCLISKDRLYDFGIRSISDVFLLSARIFWKFARL